MNDTLKKKKKRRRKNYILRLLIVIAFGVGVYYFLSSPFFDVQRIVIENNSYYTKGQIISKADVKTGQNIFGVNTAEFKDMLLSDPYIRNVRVKRSLPDTIVINIEERSEAAAVPYADIFIIIDKDGMVLRKSDAEPKLTLLVGMTIKTMDEGSPLEVEETGLLTGTLKMLDTMEKTDIFFKKIDISHTIVNAYIYDRLICEGMPENVIESMESGNLEIFLYNLYTEDIERGIIYIGSDNYFSFNPMVD